MSPLAPLLLLLSHATDGGTSDHLKARATAAYHQRRFQAACPLFEAVVKKNPYDAWGWNDLALCRIRTQQYPKVLEAFDRAGALEKVVGDPRLARAIAANVELMAASPEGEAALRPGEWNKLGELNLERKRFGAAVANFLQAEEDVSKSAASLPSAMPEVDQNTPDWKKRCAVIDPGSLARCGRRWLACAPLQRPAVDGGSPEDMGISRAFVIIDGLPLASRQTDPTELALETAEPTTPDQPGHWLEETRLWGEVRGYMDPKIWPFRTCVSIDAQSIVRLDVCAGEAVVLTHHEACDESQQSLRRMDIAPLGPSAPDAGR